MAVARRLDSENRSLEPVGWIPKLKPGVRRVEAHQGETACGPMGYVKLCGDCRGCCRYAAGGHNGSTANLLLPFYLIRSLIKKSAVFLRLLPLQPPPRRMSAVLYLLPLCSPLTVPPPDLKQVSPGRRLTVGTYYKTCIAGEDYTLISTSTPQGSSSFIRASTVLAVEL